MFLGNLVQDALTGVPKWGMGKIMSDRYRGDQIFV